MENRQNFEIFQFDKKLMKQIAKHGFMEPTPIQEKAIPPALEGKDVMGMARTGTGKTAAFVLPILQRLLPGKRAGCRALILAPTRELAEQIHTVVKDLSKGTELNSLVVYGGVDTDFQLRALGRGVDIVVACPGRLLDLVGRGGADLSGVETLVLDEADQMFDMGFIPDIMKILEVLPENRQTLMFSATMPVDVERLARTILRHPVVIEADESSFLEGINHVVYPVKHYLKTPLLLEILKSENMESILIFTRTRYRTRDLAEKLIKSGYVAGALEGDLSQAKRTEVLEKFRKKAIKILVATDVAARGLDIAGITHVVNYDLPDNPEAYVHRIGRTGRASAGGEAFSLATEEDDNLIHTLEYHMGRRFETRRIRGFRYNTPDSSEKKEKAGMGKKWNPFRKPMVKKVWEPRKERLRREKEERSSGNPGGRPGNPGGRPGNPGGKPGSRPGLGPGKKTGGSHGKTGNRPGPGKKPGNRRPQ